MTVRGGNCYPALTYRALSRQNDKVTIQSVKTLKYSRNSKKKLFPAPTRFFLYFFDLKIIIAVFKLLVEFRDFSEKSIE
jgi:hypothetical protein